MNMARVIEVVDYDPQWRKHYRDESRQIREILGGNCRAIYHIGSTSVPGLAAKPIIDMMAAVDDLDRVDEKNAEFERLGYECMGEFGIPGRRFFKKGGDQRTHHLHIFQKDNRQDIERHLAVRDYLACHTAAANEYAALKKRLAEEYRYDNDGYCDGKEEFVRELEQKALAWQKRERHRVSCAAAGIALGTGAGMLIGMTFNNPLLGMAAGIPLGMLPGLAVDSLILSGDKGDKQ